MEHHEDSQEAKRCDGIKPICSGCTDRKLECQYVDKSNRKRKQWNLDHVSTLEETISTLKGYICDLEERGFIGEKRVNINDLLAAHLDREGPSSFGIAEAVTSTEDEELITQSPGGKTVTERRLPSAIGDMSAMVWKLNICEDGTAAFTGLSGNFCFEPPARGNLLLTHSRSQEGSTGMYRGDYVQDDDLKDELMTLFMTKVNPYHQFVGPSLQIGEDPDGLDVRILQIAMCAAGSCYSHRPSASIIGQTFAESAEELALTCCRTHPSLSTVQALSTLCWYELAQDHDNMAWIYNSTASAVALHLGLHVTGFEGLVSETGSNDNDQCERIRTFWAFSLMDRIATSMLGRQCVMPWRRTRVPPILDILEAGAEPNEIAFGHQCKLWFIHDQFMDQICAFDFDELGFELRNKILVNARESLFTFYQGIDERLRLHDASSHHSILFFKMSY
ncbi:hypothetical protein K505DRAFT_379940 [Melanomma pulvis-pyrius CBS 109.77]|uniref:Xylanolytic transcriptional activator regulatory domain-containing protein n=1 Tax=Melanomma pulvis-pyrius CBS 109.77 TaxID=1314802 RepID=A0A6A6WSJ0_9PLEO|nr:hypothetical protein K505DRAFT_379940 [Melanomma pulvis-pyrius CBS 109.77]